MNRFRVALATAAHPQNMPDAKPTRRSHASLSLVVGRSHQGTSDGGGERSGQVTSDGGVGRSGQAACDGGGSRARDRISDGDLARRLATGDAWAIAEAWYRFAPMVLMMSERCLGSKSEAEDITQEVFYRVYRKATTLRDPNCLRSFVYSVAIRVLKTELRRKKLCSWLSFDQPDTLPEVGSQMLDMESRDLLRKFYVLLDRLAPRDRLVFVLRRVEAMTVEEIATHIHVSVSTVKRSMAHASNRLSHWIDAEPELVHLLDRERRAP